MACKKKRFIIHEYFFLPFLDADGFKDEILPPQPHDVIESEHKNNLKRDDDEIEFELPKFDFDFEKRGDDGIKFEVPETVIDPNVDKRDDDGLEVDFFEDYRLKSKLKFPSFHPV